MKHQLVISYAWFIGQCKKVIRSNRLTMKLLYLPGINHFRQFNAITNAYAEFERAKKEVPAYRDFLSEHHFSRPSFHGFLPRIEEIPGTDKENYVRKYSLQARCMRGTLPQSEVIIDESSGSSGTATNWARGKKERKRNARLISMSIGSVFGNEPLFVINAFAMGAWATGVNVTMSAVRFSIVKSLGPDKQKIENTLKLFGPDQRYLIMGYPPFLKMLVDMADIDWKCYNVSFIMGGEAMSEGMRSYLLGKGIKKIYSSFGASDLELNLAAENDFTISLRQLINRHQQLKTELLHFGGALPMIFQYNPADYLIETNEQGELIITICCGDTLSPKIRYNLHDKGQLVQVKEIYSLLRKFNISEKELIRPITDLPLLFHYGRSDMTVSFFGANISPSDIQETLYNLPQLASTVNSFCFSTIENENGDKQLLIDMELLQTANIGNTSAEQASRCFFDALATVNQDFREARKMATKAGQTQLRFHTFGEGPFQHSDIQIKARYIQ